MHASPSSAHTTGTRQWMHQPQTAISEALDTHDDVIAARLLDHVCNKLRRDWGAALVLLVLPRIWVQRNDGRDALRARNLAGVDHNAQLHERGVDLAATSVDDIDVVLADGLCDAHTGFADAALRDFCFAECETEPEIDVMRV